MALLSLARGRATTPLLRSNSIGNAESRGSTSSTASAPERSPQRLSASDGIVAVARGRAAHRCERARTYYVADVGTAAQSTHMRSMPSLRSSMPRASRRRSAWRRRHVTAGEHAHALRPRPRSSRSRAVAAVVTAGAARCWILRWLCSVGQSLLSHHLWKQQPLRTALRDEAAASHVLNSCSPSRPRACYSARAAHRRSRGARTMRDREADAAFVGDAAGAACAPR